MSSPTPSSVQSSSVQSDDEDVVYIGHYTPPRPTTPLPLPNPNFKPNHLNPTT
jgi:hypothetical protein